MGKLDKYLLIVTLLFSWLLAGWPPIWPLGKLGVNTIRIPPKIQEAQAATLNNEDWEAFSDGDTTLSGSFWSNLTGDGCDMQTDSGGTPSSNTGPSVDHTYGDSTHKYLYLETSSGWCIGDGLYAQIETDNVDADAYSVDIDFWWHMYGSTIGSLHLDVYDGTWHESVWSRSGQGTPTANAWYNQQVDLDAYTGTIKLRFRAISAGDYYGDLALDDIEITGELRVEVPDAPTLYTDDGGSNQIAFNNIRQNSTTPTFRASATHTEDLNRFQLELNAAADFSGTAYTQTFSGTYTTGAPYNLTANDLSPSLPTTDGATYYVRARASADGGTNYGAWSTDSACCGTWSYTYKSASENPGWFQTTDEQFDIGTLSNTNTSGSGSVQLESGEGEVKVDTACGDSTYATGESYEWYSKWTPSGSGTVTVTKLWFWDGNGSIGSGETIPMAMYNDGGSYDKISGSDATLTGTGATGWISAEVSSPFEITLGSTYWIGATGANGTAYIIYRDGSADCANYSPTGSGSYYQSNDYSLDSSVPTGASQSSNKYIIPGISYSSGYSSPGTIISPAIDYDWLLGATAWNEFSWSEEETGGIISMQVYRKNTVDCDTLVSDSLIPNNSTGIASSPIDLSVLDELDTTHNRLCLKATLIAGSSTPYLQDWTLKWTTVAVSISLTTDGSVGFGYVALDTTQDTTASGIDDVETVTVDSGPTDLGVRSTTFADNGNTWTLGSSNGSNQVKWEFSENGSDWSTFSLADTVYSLDTSVPESETRNVYLKITMPTATDSYNQYSSTITIQASAP